MIALALLLSPFALHNQSTTRRPWAATGGRERVCMMVQIFDEKKRFDGS
jgi:hypothetical protein